MFPGSLSLVIANMHIEEEYMVKFVLKILISKRKRISLSFQEILIFGPINLHIIMNLTIGQLLCC